MMGNINHTGMSLVEVMIAIAIMGMTSLTLTQVTQQISKSQALAEAAKADSGYGVELNRFLHLEENCNGTLGAAVNGTLTTALNGRLGATIKSSSGASLRSKFATTKISVSTNEKNMVILSSNDVGFTSDINYLGLPRQALRTIPGAVNYGDRTVTDQILANVVLLDDYQGFSQKKSFFTPVGSLTKTSAYKIFRGEIQYNLRRTADLALIKPGMPVRIYFVTNGVGNIVSCSSRPITSFGTVNRFCRTLGADFAMAFKTNTASPQLSCLVPVYDPGTTPPLAAGMKITKPTHYISLSEALCNLGVRGYKLYNYNRFCDPAAF